LKLIVIHFSPVNRQFALGQLAFDGVSKEKNIELQSPNKGHSSVTGFVDTQSINFKLNQLSVSISW